MDGFEWGVEHCAGIGNRLALDQRYQQRIAPSLAQGLERLRGQRRNAFQGLEVLRGEPARGLTDQHQRPCLFARQGKRGDQCRLDLVQTVRKGLALRNRGQVGQTAGAGQNRSGNRQEQSGTVRRRRCGQANHAAVGLCKVGISDPEPLLQDLKQRLHRSVSARFARQGGQRLGQDRALLEHHRFPLAQSLGFGQGRPNGFGLADQALVCLEKLSTLCLKQGFGLGPRPPFAFISGPRNRRIIGSCRHAPGPVLMLNSACVSPSRSRSLRVISAVWPNQATQPSMRPSQKSASGRGER